MKRAIHCVSSAVAARIALCALIAFAACAPTLRPEPYTPPPIDDAGVVLLDAGADATVWPTRSGVFTHALQADGTLVTYADATSATLVVRLDLDSGEAEGTDDPAREGSWDIGFRRFYVVTNGGVSGSGPCAAAEVQGVSYDALVEVPSEVVWRLDAMDSEEDDDAGEDTAFNGGVSGAEDWYDYDLATHTLTPRARVYLVRTTEQRVVKLQLEGYYDDAGTAAFLHFRWAFLDTPSTEISAP